MMNLQEYEFGKYKFFDVLVSINNSLNLAAPNTNVRNSSYNIVRINYLLKQLVLQCKKSNDLNSLLQILLNTLGCIFMLQPFYDGNSRTLKIFLVNFLKLYGYHVTLNINDMVIPLFYSENDICDQKDIDVLKLKITTQQ